MRTVSANVELFGGRQVDLEKHRRNRAGIAQRVLAADRGTEIESLRDSIAGCAKATRKRDHSSALLGPIARADGAL